MIKQLKQQGLCHIIRSAKIILVLSLSLACTGCFLAKYVDEHAEFEMRMEKNVGESRPLSRYQRGLGKIYIIVDYLGVKAYQENNGIPEPEVPGSGFFPHYRICSYDYYVAVETGIVLGWRYLDGTEPFRCQGNRFKLGNSW